MKINNKEFKDWIAEDLQVLIYNDTYRENNFIDYKVNFAPLECTDKKKKKEKQAEFRKDVCSFANADGGYIFFGIGEDSGMAGALIGITLTNPDRFELERRNELQSIQPVMPEVDFAFIQLQEDKYVVVLHIHRGLHKPYIIEEQEGEFHFYTRRGNKKQAMTYTEMRNDFLNAVMLSEDIKEFRKERLEKYIEEMKKPFALMHIVPATFKNSMDYIPMFELYKQGTLNFDKLFDGMISDRAVPNVDGVYFPDYFEQCDYEQLQIFNNGSIELKMDLQILEQNKKRYLIILEFINELEKLIINTSNNILCMPIEIRNILDNEQVKASIEDSVKMTKYSLGIGR